MNLQRNTVKSGLQLDKIRDIPKNIRFQQIIISIVIFMIIYSFVASSATPQRYNLSEGEIATVDIISPKDVKNQYKIQNAIEQAVRDAGEVYIPDRTIQQQVIEDVKAFFNKVFEIKYLQGDVTDEIKAQRLSSESPISLTQDDYNAVIKAKNEDIVMLRDKVILYLNQAFDQNINDREEDIRSKKQDFSYSIASLQLNKELRDLGTKIGLVMIKPNMVYNSQETEEMINKVKEKIELSPEMVVKKYQKIVGKGDVITKEHISLLKDLNLLEQQKKIDLPLYIGIGILIALFEGLVIVYAYRFEWEILNDIRKLILLCIIITLVLTFAKLLWAYNISGFLVPVSFAAMLVAILMSPRLAIILNIALSALVMLMIGYNIDTFIVAIIGGSAGAAAVSRMHQRSDLITAGILISFVNVLSIIGTSLVSSTVTVIVFKQSLLGVVNGVLSSIFTLGLLPFCEATFNIVTPLKLLELSNPNQPLLKKLLFEAPGTYHHSVIVGNLAEAAVDAIGGNSLLARVGSYYHDIGKIKRPYFFKENQLSKENPHDKMTPSLSTLIITNHIKDGVEMAKKYKLPNVIMDMIKQHHGTTLVKYFYIKAVNDIDSKSGITEEQFRYEGPKPGSKESAVLMLADCVEAAVRSISAPTKDSIEDMVNKIIRDKLEDRQLDDSLLTLKDINLITGTFLNVLNGIYHDRIEYPDIPVNDKGDDKNEPNDRQQTK